jgi:ABC-type nickel/cobalt efflux system permease component RcnA
MTNHPARRDELIIDPARYDLDAAWVQEASAWARVCGWVLDRVRHQTAVIGIGAIVVLLWLTEARAHDPSLLFALGAIVVITVAAEWMDGKTTQQSRGQGAAQSGHAAPDQAAD